MEKMQKFLIYLFCLLLSLHSISTASFHKKDSETSVQFGFQTENGQIRSEQIKYNMTANAVEDIDTKKPDAVEYQGGYSFISSDGYEYSVRYRANKNGFLPYVTARKIVHEE